MRKLAIGLFMAVLSMATTCNAAAPLYRWVSSSDTSRYEVDVNNVFRSGSNPDIIVFQDKVINYPDQTIFQCTIIADMYNRRYKQSVDVYQKGKFSCNFTEDWKDYTDDSYLDGIVVFASKYAHNIRGGIL